VINKYTDLLGNKFFEEKFNSNTDWATFEQRVAKDAISHRKYKIKVD